MPSSRGASKVVGGTRRDNLVRGRLTYEGTGTAHSEVSALEVANLVASRSRVILVKAVVSRGKVSMGSVRRVCLRDVQVRCESISATGTPTMQR